MKKLGIVTWFMGINIANHNKKGFLLTQTPYVDNVLERFKMNENIVKSVTLSSGGAMRRFYYQPETEKKDIYPYRKLIGCLLLLGVCTWSQIGDVAMEIARYFTDPQEYYWEELKGVLSYLMGTKKVSLYFKNEVIISS